MQRSANTGSDILAEEEGCHGNEREKNEDADEKEIGKLCLFLTIEGGHCHQRLLIFPAPKVPHKVVCFSVFLSK